MRLYSSFVREGRGPDERAMCLHTAFSFASAVLPHLGCSGAPLGCHVQHSRASVHAIDGHELHGQHTHAPRAGSLAPCGDGVRGAGRPHAGRAAAEALAAHGGRARARQHGHAFGAQPYRCVHYRNLLLKGLWKQNGKEALVGHERQQAYRVRASPRSAAGLSVGDPHAMCECLVCFMQSEKLTAIRSSSSLMRASTRGYGVR
jgi:hypothetical protein